jgi:hypothetical protein
VQAWDRYAYANNNPVRYNDPSGHDVGCAGRDASECRKEPNQKQTPPINPTAIAGVTQIAEGKYTPPAGPILIPGKKSTTTATTTSTPSPSIAIDPDVVEYSFDAFLMGRDALEYSAKGLDAVTPNPLISISISGGIQLYKDKSLNISYSEKLARSTLVGLEGVTVDLISTGFGIGGGVLGVSLFPAAAPIGAAGGYLLGAVTTYVILTAQADKLNNSTAFPWIRESFGNR